MGNLRINGLKGFSKRMKGPAKQPATIACPTAGWKHWRIPYLPYPSRWLVSDWRGPEQFPCVANHGSQMESPSDFEPSGLHSWFMHWKTTQAQSSMASPQVFIGYWKTNGTFSSPRNKHTFLFYRQVAALGGGQGGGIVTAAKECDTTVSAVPVSLPRSRFWQKDCGDTLKWSQKPWEAWGIPENGQPVPGNEYEQTIFETISQEQLAICAYSLNSFHSSNNRGQY